MERQVILQPLGLAVTLENIICRNTHNCYLLYVVDGNRWGFWSDVVYEDTILLGLNAKVIMCYWVVDLLLKPQIEFVMSSNSWKLYQQLQGTFNNTEKTFNSPFQHTQLTVFKCPACHKRLEALPSFNMCACHNNPCMYIKYFLSHGFYTSEYQPLKQSQSWEKHNWDLPTLWGVFAGEVKCHVSSDLSRRHLRVKHWPLCPHHPSAAAVAALQALWAGLTAWSETPGRNNSSRTPPPSHCKTHRCSNPFHVDSTGT